MPRKEAEVASSVTGFVEKHSAASAAASDVADAKVASADWKKAAQDEFVRRVQDAVGGMLFDVQPSKKGEESP